VPEPLDPFEPPSFSEPSGLSEPASLSEPSSLPEPTDLPEPFGRHEPSELTEPPRWYGESATETLPQRVPAKPDVPTVPEPDADEPPAQAPELARIWSHLRRGDMPPRPEGFDMDAVVEAVERVPGVREAKVRTNPSGGHNLRLELNDGADAAQVSRRVAQLLQEQMGLSAAPRDLSGGLPRGGDPLAAATPDTGRERRRHTLGRAENVARGRAHVDTPAADGDSTLGLAPPSHAAPAPPAPPQTAPLQTAPPQDAPFQTSPAPHMGPHPVPGPLVPAVPAPGPLVLRDRPGPRVLIDQVQVSTYGLDATVEVRLTAGPRRATGVSSGPAVDGYLLRLAADAAVKGINQLLRAEVGASEPRGQCYLEHTSIVPFGSCEVAIVVAYLACAGWVEQLAGSAVVIGDARQAVVRAVLAAVNRRLEALLS
jgi:hypothetical protein